MSIYRLPKKMHIASLLAVTLAIGAIPSISYAEAAKPATASTLPANDFVKPVSQYKLYVLAELDELVAETREFTDAVKKGDIAKAKTLYAPARIHYERIEPAAEIFGDLDPAIDAREDDFKLGIKDKDFTGFHHLEYLLFSQNTTAGADVIADKLMADVLELQKRLQDEAIPVVTMVQGAADLMDEIAQTKITGEEDRYSRTDLWDFSGNLEGSAKIVELLSPLIKKVDNKFYIKTEANLKEAANTLNKYRTADGKGFKPYTEVTEKDKVLMKSQITTLAEDLSTLRAKLGLD